MNAVQVTNLRKSYDGLEAVRGVSFDLRAGEVFGLLGPNGAGKTTTVEILEGYGEPDQLPAGRRGGRDRDRGSRARPPRPDGGGPARRAPARRARGAPADARGRLPVAHRGRAGVRLFAHQFRAEQKLFWRSRELAFFTFLLPIVFFLILASAYGDEEIEGANGYLYLLAGMIGYGGAATAFAGLALLLVIRRESGVLKRLRATPLPGQTYIAAVLASIIFVFFLEAVLLVVMARVAFDVAIPENLFSLALVVALGAASFAALGVGLTTVIRSAEGSSAVVNAIYLPVTFISGSFFSSDAFPRVLKAIAEVLPLVHLIRLVRDVVVFDDQIWEHPIAVAVIAAWGLAGAVVAVRGFRWEPRER